MGKRILLLLSVVIGTVIICGTALASGYDFSQRRTHSTYSVATSGIMGIPVMDGAVLAAIEQETTADLQRACENYLESARNILATQRQGTCTESACVAVPDRLVAVREDGVTRLTYVPR